MGLPGHRRTSSHKRRRAAHFALTAASLGVCPKCKNPVLPHTVCRQCGFYKGREIVKMSLAKKSGKGQSKTAQEKHEHK